MERTCNNCKRVGTKWCNKCVSTAEEQYSKFKPSETWLDSIFKECMNLEKAMNELRSEKIIIPTQEEEKNMEYKTKEELQLSIEKMETELAKMKEALKKTEEENIFWRPTLLDTYYSILRTFTVATYTHHDTTDEAVRSYNCFPTYAEASEAANDLKTLFMLYRLSRKSMEKYQKGNDIFIMRHNPTTNTIQWASEDGRERCQLCSFSTHADAKQAYQVIGKENLIKLFKKF